MFHCILIQGLKNRISKKIIFFRCYEDSLKMSRKLDASYWYCYMLLLYVFFLKASHVGVRIKYGYNEISMNKWNADYFLENV